MAIEGDGGSSTITVEDTQPPFDRRDMVKKTKLVTVLKASTDNGDIYYNHPLYRSQQKKQSNENIQGFTGGPPPPPRTPPPRGIRLEIADETKEDEINEIAKLEAEEDDLERQFDEHRKVITQLEDAILKTEEALEGASNKEAETIKGELRTFKASKEKETDKMEATRKKIIETLKQIEAMKPLAADMM